MYEETYPWPIKCHICLSEFTVELGRMKAEKALRCPDCGVDSNTCWNSSKVSWPRRYDSALTHTGTCSASRSLCSSSNFSRKRRQRRASSCARAGRAAFASESACALSA